MQWLFEAKRRYGLVILNYAVTSNHIHLLVVDDSDRRVIPDSIKLIAGRTGQEYNQRKHRKGAFWEDRYHATAVEANDHLLQCLVYIDLNMVRAGVVRHPSEWLDGGYNEIQHPKRKNVLINYERLRELLGYDTYAQVQAGHKKWVESCLATGGHLRDDKWSRSIAVGSKDFIEKIKTLMRALALGRKPVETGESYQLREPQIPYGDRFGAQKLEIEPENAYIWG